MTEEKLTQEQTDEKMIDEAFQELLDQYLKSKHRKKVEIITKAFNFARQAHKGVRGRALYSTSYRCSTHRLRRNRLRIYLYLFCSTPRCSRRY